MNALTPEQLDALRELANVGCGQAAGALSRMLGGKPVHTDLPWAGASTAAEAAQRMGGRASAVVASAFRTGGGLGSSLLLVLFEDDAYRLCRALLRDGRDSGPPLGEVERSALSEAANIVASACLNAVGQLTGLTLIPSVPALKETTAVAVMEGAMRQAGFAQDPAVTLEARFYTPSEPQLGGWVVLVPDRAETQGLLRRLGV